MFSTIYSYTQTEEETVDFLNSIFTTHSNGSMLTSFKILIKDESKFLQMKTILTYGGGQQTILELLLPEKATFYTSSLNTANTLLITLSFMPNSVLLIQDNKIINKDDHTSISLIDMDSEKAEKVKKAYKHLIKQLGGTVKEDLF